MRNHNVNHTCQHAPILIVPPMNMPFGTQCAYIGSELHVLGLRNMEDYAISRIVDMRFFGRLVENVRQLVFIPWKNDLMTPMRTGAQIAPIVREYNRKAMIFLYTSHERDVVVGDEDSKLLDGIIAEPEARPGLLRAVVKAFNENASSDEIMEIVLTFEPPIVASA